MKPITTKLSNNLPVVFIETESFPSFTMLLLVKSGSRYETTENNGIAHFFEHMVFKGSKNYPNAHTIASKVEGIGGIFNAFTSKDHTGYWIKAPTKHFELVTNILSDMLINPLLESEEIEREKGVIIEEMNMYEDSPASRVGDIYENLLYEPSPLGFDIIGTKETVSSFTRDTFTSYIDQLYKPSNAILAIAGGFKGSSAEHSYLDIVRKAFSGWKDGKACSFKPHKDNQLTLQTRVRKKDTEQAHFVLGFRAFSQYDDRRYALAVLNGILGKGMSSRLFTELRERRGLCYYVSTGREMYEDVGNFATQAGVPNSVDKLQEVIKVTIDQHNQMKQGTFTDDEIIRAKELLKGRLVLSLEDSQSVAGYYGDKVLFDMPLESPDEISKNIDEVTKQDIVSLARDLFERRNLNIALIGPFEKSNLDMEFDI